jgi:ADP-ribose pyrophosphatase
LGSDREKFVPIDSVNSSGPARKELPAASKGMPVSAKAPVTESRVVYDGRIFRAVVEEVRLPHRDSDSTVEIVVHAGSVVIAAMPTPDTVLLVRQYRHQAEDWLWELPAGSIDPGENAADAARRECHEELGLIAGEVRPTGEMWPLPGYCTEYMTFFRATGVRAPAEGEPAAHTDEDEDIEAKPFTLSQVRRMVMDGEIKDLKTAAALVWLEGIR